MSHQILRIAIDTKYYVLIYPFVSAVCTEYVCQLLDSSFSQSSTSQSSSKNLLVTMDETIPPPCPSFPLTHINHSKPSVSFFIFNIFFLFQLCILPQLTLSLKFSCVDISSKWLLRLNTAVNLIIYLPEAATFLLFILPSQTYFHVFRTQSQIGKRLYNRWATKNTVVPLTTTRPRMIINGHTENQLKILKLQETVQ